MILAIDPGNVESGYVVWNDDLSIIKKGKIPNEELLVELHVYLNDYRLSYDKELKDELHIAIEMIASYGMAVGQSVFETCLWVGRFTQEVYMMTDKEPTLIYRKDEKMNLCGTMKAKDSNISQALVDRFAPNTRNKGKGTKANKGWFYGFKSDIWAAYAVAVTYHDLYLKEWGNEKVQRLGNSKIN